MSIRDWIDSAFSGGNSADRQEADRLSGELEAQRAAGEALSETLSNLTDSIAALERQQESQGSLSDEAARRLGELRRQYEDTNVEIQENERRIREANKALEDHNAEVGRARRGYDEWAKGLAGAGTAQGAVNRIVQEGTSRLQGHTTTLIALGAATAAWNLHMKAAARGAKDLLNAGAPLPVNQERLNEALAASEARFQKVNSLAAVMTLRYGIAGEQVNNTADIIQEKLRLLDSDFGNSAAMTGETIAQLTRNALLFSRVTRTDVAKSLEMMERRFWDMGGSPQSKLATVRKEMRAVHDAIMDINKDGSDIFPEDLANSILDVAAATDSYGQNLTALTTIMATAYKRSGELGASYRQQVRIGSQMIKGLQNVDDSIAYMAGRRLLTRARADVEKLVEGLDPNKKEQVRNLMEDRSVGDFDKARILQEMLGNETVGLEATLNASSRFTKGKVGAGIFQDIFKFERLEDAYLARKIFQSEGAEGVKKFVDEVKTREKRAAEGGGKDGELFGKKEEDALRQAVGREEGSVLAKMYNAAPDWLKPTLEHIAVTANNSMGILQIGAGIIALHALMKLFLGRRMFPIPLPVIGAGGAGPGAGGPGPGRGGRGGGPGPGPGPGPGRGGRLGRAGRIGMAAAGAAAAGYGLWSIFGGDDADDLSETDQVEQTQQPGFVERNGGWLGLGLTGLAAGQLGAWAYGTRAGAGAARLAGRGALGAGKLLGRGALAAGRLIATPAGMVAASGAAGYGAGTLIDRKFGISSGIASIGLDREHHASELGAASHEAKKWGMTDLEYWTYVKGGKSGATTDPITTAQDNMMISRRDSGEKVRSPEEIYKLMVSKGKGRMRAATSLAAKYGFASAGEVEARQYQENMAAFMSMPEGFRNSAVGTMWKSQLDTSVPKAGPGGMSGGRGGGLSMGARGFKRAPKGNEVVALQPMRVAPDGTLKMEWPGFYGLLETWYSERSVLNRAWKYMTGGSK